MIFYKTKDEIEIMKQGGCILKKVINEIKRLAKPGVKTKEINQKAEKLITSYGAEAAFAKVKNYFWATCLPVNEEIVHSPPSEKVLREGDLLTIDIGVFYRGFNTDYAETFLVGKKRDIKVKKFLETGIVALEKAIDQFRVGNYLGQVSKTIEEVITKNGYFIIKRLTGHGIGRQLHEDPHVYGFLNEPLEKTLVIKPGLVVAIEVIYSMGTEEMVYVRDEPWVIKTSDNSLSACFEKTVAVVDKDKKAVILT